MSKQVHVRMDDSLYEALSAFTGTTGQSVQDCISVAIMQMLGRQKSDQLPHNADFTFIDLFAGIGGMRHLRGDNIAGRFARLALHLLHGADRALAAVQRGDRLLHGFARGDHRHDLLMADGFELLLREEVQRVAHGDEQLVADELDRHDAELLGDILRHIACKLHGDGHRRQVDELDAELHLQRLDELLLRDKAGVVYQEKCAIAINFF